MSLRFLKREAKLCGFLRKSFLAREQRVKASGRMQLTAESRRQTLGELTQQLCRPCRGSSRWAAVAVAWGHWGLRTAPTQQQEEGRRAGQCQGLDEAVVQLTKLVQQNQVSLDRVLLAMRAACLGGTYPQGHQGALGGEPVGERATYPQDSLEAVRLAGELAQRETCSALKLAKRELEGTELKSLEGLAQCRKEAKAHPWEVQEKVGAMRQELAVLLDLSAAQGWPPRAEDCRDPGQGGHGSPAEQRRALTWPSSGSKGVQKRAQPGKDPRLQGSEGPKDAHALTPQDCARVRGALRGWRKGSQHGR
ncbi:hypothetical protein MUG91_G234n49 [Manis pentadactyla]|nr:hypothetical protein MUG91_G234n49 [Manis pentadactyla]